MAVLVGLAVLWAIVLLPDFIRRASTRSSHDTIGSFKHHLSVLERANPVHSPVTGSGRRPSNVVPLIPRSAPPVGNLDAAPLSAPHPVAPMRAVPVAARRGPARPAAAPAPRQGVHARRPAQPARPAQAVRPASRPGAQPRPRVDGAAVAQRRRQDIITALFAASLLSFLAFLSFGGPMLIVHVVVDVLLVLYVGLVLLTTRREREITPATQHFDHRGGDTASPVYATAGAVRRVGVR